MRFLETIGKKFPLNTVHNFQNVSSLSLANNLASNLKYFQSSKNLHYDNKFKLCNFFTSITKLFSHFIFYLCLVSTQLSPRAVKHLILSLPFFFSALYNCAPKYLNLIDLVKKNKLMLKRFYTKFFDHFKQYFNIEVLI